MNKDKFRSFIKHNFQSGFKLLKTNPYVQHSLSKTLKILFGNRVFALMVVIPVLIYFLYNALIFTPRYESTATIAIKDNSSSVNIGGFGALLGSASSGTTNPYMLQQYILSLNMLQALEKDIHLLDLYRSHRIDWFSRLSSAANQKKQLDYFTSKIDVTYNQDSQSLDVSAQGVTSKEAQFILQGIINKAQDYVNGVDYQLADKRLKFAQKQVQLAQEKLSETNEKIINFQNNNDILDPKSDLATYAGILASLQSQLVVAQTELVNLQDYLQNNSPQVDKQQQKIASLQQQIETQKQKILGVDGGRNVKLNAVVNKFEWLRMQAQVAVSEYTAAIASLESAKADAIKQKQQVVILQAPTLPDFHEYPRLWYNTFTLFIILLMIYGIVRMAKTIIDEHRY